MNVKAKGKAVPVPN